MIEMLGVLAVVGILSAGGIVGYSTAMENYKINKTIEDMNLIATNVITFFNKPATPFTQLSGSSHLGLFCQLNLVSESVCNKMMVNNYRYNNHLGTINDIYFNYSTEKTSLFLGVGRLSKAQCIKVATHNWLGISKITRITIQEKSGMDYGSAGVRDTSFLNTLPTIEQADTACTLTTGKTMRVAISFYQYNIPPP